MKKAIAIILSIMLVLAITFPAAAISSIAVKSIKLNNSKITMKVGQTSNLKVTFTPANTSQKKLTYVTDNKNIATVNTPGKITGISSGTTTITVYTLNEKIFSKCDVIISTEDEFKKTMNISIATWDIETDMATQYKDATFQKIAKKLKHRIIKPVNLTWDDYSQKVQIWASSGQLPDIFSIDTVGSQYYTSWKNQGVIKPLPTDLEVNIPTYRSIWIPRISKVCWIITNIIVFRVKHTLLWTTMLSTVW